MPAVVILSTAKDLNPRVGSYYREQYLLNKYLCCRITNVLMFKIISNNLRSVLSTSQIRPNLLQHFRLIVRALPAHRIGLDVLIEKFVRIQLRTVPRQVEQPEVFSMPMNPAFDLSGTMHRMTIHNQKDFLPVLFYQSPKKVDHHRPVESLLEDHKCQSTPVRNRRNHIAAEPLAGSWNDRRLPLETITAPSLMIGTHPHFVAPVDLGTFCAGLLTDHRIVVFQPALDRFGVLLVGATKRFLWRKAPVFQIATHRPDRNRKIASFFDQLAYRVSGPQGKGKFQLIGTPVGDQADDGCGLMTGQTRLMFGATLVRLQGYIATLSVRLEPMVNRCPSHTKDVTRLGLGHLLFENRMNDSVPQFLLRLWGKFSAIVCFHKSSYDFYPYMFNKLCSG